MRNPIESDKVIEILTLDIKPDRRDEFHQMYVNESLPLLKKCKFDVDPPSIVRGEEGNHIADDSWDRRSDRI